MDKILTKKNIIFTLIYFDILIFLRYMKSLSIISLLESIIITISILLFIFLGKKSLLWSAIIFTIVITHSRHQYQLYIGLLIYTISAFLNRPYLIPLSILYHLNTLSVLLYDKNVNILNVVIYYSICVILFIVLYNYNRNNNNSKKLLLTIDEKLILNELIQGKQLKEIDTFSKNTKTEKLKQAYERNNLINKNELIYMYKWEQSH